MFLKNSLIPVVGEARFLGLIFDKKLNFKSHISEVKTISLKALNLLRVLSNTNWGADRKVLLRLYRSLVRSKLDYGSIVYGSTCKSYIGMLDTVHNQGIRICLGASRTSLFANNERAIKQFGLRLENHLENVGFAQEIMAQDTIMDKP